MAVFSQSLIGSDVKTYSIEFTPGANRDIPLTTIFTPPSSCLATVTYDNAGLWQGGLLQKGPIPTDPSLITVDPQDVEANTVYADIIQIQWAMTDSDILRLMSQSTSSSSSQAQPTAAQTAHQTMSNVDPTLFPTSTMTSTQASDNGSLSAGAKAGIGIGAAVGAVVLTLLAYFLGRWRRTKRQNNGMEDGSNTKEEDKNNANESRSMHELPPAQEELPPTCLVELPSKNAQELPTREVRSELGSMR
ncbi:MAG: hypothetical protein Q9207_004334 [Kuettlingeria erythrocarpa]